MCLECKYCKWLECTNENLTDEEIRKLENGDLDETNCSQFTVYWSKESNPYEASDERIG